MTEPDARMVRIAEIEIDPGQLSAYNAFLTDEITASIEREPGVLMLHAVSEKTAPHRIRILEVYASIVAYEAHIQTPHFLKYKTGTAAMVTSLRLVDVDPIALASQVAQSASPSPLSCHARTAYLRQSAIPSSAATG